MQNFANNCDINLLKVIIIYNALNGGAIVGTFRK